MTTSTTHSAFTGLRLALAGLTALAVAIGIGRFAFTPILPMMQRDAGLSLHAGGWLASANYVGYLLGALLATVLPLRAAIAARAGLLTIGVATLCMGLTGGYLAWILLRGIAGLASAWVLIFASAGYLKQLASLQRSILGGAVFAGVGAGIMGTGVLCLTLMQWNAGAAETWLILGAIALALSAPLWNTLGFNDTSPANGNHNHFRAGSDAARLIIAYGACGFGYIIPATFLPLMAQQMMHNPAVFGWAWPVFGAAAMLSTLAAAALRRSFNNRALWIGSQLIMAIGVALPALWSGVMVIMLSALLVGGTFMVTTMAGIQEAHDIAGPGATRLIAILTSVFALGQIAGPIAAGSLVRQGNFSAALLAAAGVLAFGACVLWRRPPVTALNHGEPAR